MYLTIDAGNTRTKAVIYDTAGQALESIIAEENNIAPIHDLITRHAIEHVIISTTGKREWDLSELGIKGHNIDLSHDTPMPIQLIYTTHLFGSG